MDQNRLKTAYNEIRKQYMIAAEVLFDEGRNPVKAEKLVWAMTIADHCAGAMLVLSWLLEEKPDELFPVGFGYIDRQCCDPKRPFYHGESEEAKNTENDLRSGFESYLNSLKLLMYEQESC